MKIIKLCIAAAIAAAWSASASGGVTATEAKALGTTLTEWGAEKAANADGSIPAYEQGIKNVAIPADFKPGSGRYPDPFKSEKPILKIDARNMAQYANLVSPGYQELLRRFPDYYLNVYPTRRTTTYPDWVAKNTVKNATTAKLVGEVDGDGVEGAFGGIPFPIPKSGAEAMWNQALKWSGTRTDQRFGIYFMDSSGRRTLIGDQETKFLFPYYDRGASALQNKVFEVGYTTYYGPPAQSGSLFLQHYSINHAAKDDATWVYLPGQRRVRLAPEFKYDTPAASIGGALLFDEIGGFLGRKDRFDFKLVGKKEMLVPANNYAAVFSPDMLGPQHLNPAVERWEKHRVWVVEATLKPGKRHIYAKRTFYLDEDSWMLVLNENYDQSGKLYRVGSSLSYTLYDKPRISPTVQVYYDLTKGNYMVSGANGDPQYYTKPFDDMPNMSPFTPDAMGNSGVR